MADGLNDLLASIFSSGGLPLPSTTDDSQTSPINPVPATPVVPSAAPPVPAAPAGNIPTPRPSNLGPQVAGPVPAPVAPAPAAPAPPSPTGQSPFDALRAVLSPRPSVPPNVAASSLAQQPIQFPFPTRQPPKGDTFADALRDIAAGAAAGKPGMNKGRSFVSGFAGTMGSEADRREAARKQAQDQFKSDFDMAMRATQENRARQGQGFTQGLQTHQEQRLTGTAQTNQLKAITDAMKGANPTMTDDVKARVMSIYSSMYGHSSKLGETNPAQAKQDWDQTIDTLKKNFPGMDFSPMEKNPPPGISKPGTTPTPSPRPAPPPVAPPPTQTPGPTPGAPVAQASGSGGTKQDAARPQTQDDYNSLSPGSYYYDADGNMRQKQ
jgi:hypothetical protein